MSKSEADVLSEVEAIVREVVAPAAHQVDAEAAFPRASIDALARAGVLGLVSATDVGGLGLGPRAAAAVVERLAGACGSTAMVTTMHLAAAAVIEKHAPEPVRREVATGRRLVTLAFSEAGSRSHFWAPLGTARADGEAVVLDGAKSWVTSANHADYVWSSRPLAAEGASTLWLVPRATAGLSIPARFDGLGLRGNDSAPVMAKGVRLSGDARLGADGAGFDVMMGVVLPLFQVLSAACSLGLMEAAVARTAEHVSGTRLEHLGSPLRDLPTIRAYVARMRIQTDMVRGLLDDTLRALEGGRADAMLRVLEAKAAAGESATQVLDTAMRVCGGAAFRKDVGVERLFRDARAATVMAPTTDVLYDFVGKAVCGMELFA